MYTKKLKIAIIFKPHTKIQIPSLGGMSNFVYFLSKGLIDLGHAVTVFASKNSKLPKGVNLEKCLAPERSVNIYEAGELFYREIENKYKYPRDIVNQSFGELADRFHHQVENYLSAFSTINAEKFDIAHIVSQDITALYPAIFSPVPTVVSLHGYHGLLSPIEKRWLKHLQSIRRKKQKLNCHFISVSKFIQKEYSKFLNSDLIYNSIDISNYHLNSSKNNYIVFLGRIEDGKGVDFAARFSCKYHIPLIIAGHITDQWYFDNKLKKYIDNSLIKFVGAINEKQKNKLLGEAKALLMPTRYRESFGRVVIESLACGTPVIAFRNGAIPELVKNNKTGFLIRQDDFLGAKKALDNISKIKPKVCRQFVEDNFTLSKMVKKYEAIYKKNKK